MIQKLTLKYVVIASFIIGVMFTLSFGIYGYSFYDIYLHRDTTGGIIESIDYDKGITNISYQTEDMTIKKTFHFIDSGFKEHEETTIYYDTRDPKNSFIYEQISIILFFFGLGIVSLVIHGITLFIYKHPKKDKKKKSVKVL